MYFLFCFLEKLKIKDNQIKQKKMNIFFRKNTFNNLFRFHFRKIKAKINKEQTVFNNLIFNSNNIQINPIHS